MTPFHNTPQELRALPQWCVWRLETTDTGRTTKVPYNPVTFALVSSTDPSTWVPFDVALAGLDTGVWSGLGFVLADSDPYCFVDLDDPYALDPATGQPKHADPQAIVKLQGEVFERFKGTYAELSPSGKGLHIIGIGIVPSGRRRHGVELYSSARFMTMTGNVFAPNPLIDVQDAVTWLYNEMGGAPQVTTFVGSYEDKEPDHVVIQKCLNAANGDKVRDLVSGNWQHHYPSQSEADFALIDIIAYYTQSRFQIMRLFRQSALGQREKANRDAYVNGMIDRAFDRMPTPLDIDGIRNMLEAEFGQKPWENGSGRDAIGGVATTPAYPAQVGEAVQPTPQPVAVPPAGDNPYLRKVPGLLGQIAYYIYDQAPRPVPEIALAGAIGLMAGICGRAYNVSGTGLNQYTLLLAGTGRGKEAIQSGISKLMTQVIDIGIGGCPAASEFLGPGEISSGQALIKHFDKVSKSFVSIIGEVDVTLKNMTARNAHAGLTKLRQVMLAAYSASGRNNILPGTIYSDRDKNAAPITSPAFSMIGEGTPGRFYNLLDESMVSDGLLPRFNIIEYDGHRTDLNEARLGNQPPLSLVKQVAALCGQALMLNQSNRPIDVGYTPEAKAMLSSFEKTITGLINAAHNETIEELWNRAHLKALKLAGLIAVGVNPMEPVIDQDMADYAITLIKHSTDRVVAKFQSGDVGEGLTKQLSDAKKAIHQLMNLSEKRAKSLGMTFEMCRDKLISHRGLQQATSNVSSFKNSREGAAIALRNVIQALMDGGVIAVVPPQQIADKYGKGSGRFYMVVDPSGL
jgi:hypothetical protein